jgi:hypothetical protein
MLLSLLLALLVSSTPAPTLGGEEQAVIEAVVAWGHVTPLPQTLLPSAILAPLVCLDMHAGIADHVCIQEIVTLLEPEVRR